MTAPVTPSGGSPEEGSQRTESSNAEQDSNSNTPAFQSTSDTFAPALGTFIEVLWVIEEGGESGEGPKKVEERWWGAVVQSRIPRSAELPRGGHILHYDSFGEFVDEVCRVTFTSSDELIDLGRDNATLYWRIAGTETPEPSPAKVVSMSDVLRAQAAVDEEEGSSAEAALSALSDLPVTEQMHLASGYRTFADRVKGMLAELSERNGPQYVVTHADIQNIFERLRSEPAAGGV